MNTDIQLQARCTAHEIRNHISICELYSEIIRKNLELENIKSEKIENALNCIKRSLKIMANNLIDLKSIDNICLDTYDLKSILDMAVGLAKIYIGDKQIKLTTNINETAYVTLDDNKFLACVVNIIKNAIEAIPEKGEVVVSLKIKDNLAKIKIINNGTPITKEQQKKIFTQGFTTKKTGTGLGLYICKSNLEEQDASLNLVKSDKNETVFEITIPVNAQCC
ncbi:HAMP domain-containing histidine kinase [bacterium]|nr:HAMP domain-containing histidine kinase [bacterium]